MNPSRRILLELSRAGDGRVDLGQAALLIAQEDDPDLEVRPYLARLDELAARAAPVTRGLRPEQAARALVGYLFDEAGFRGNEDDYYDPRNSYLNEVLDRRRGIPITLAVVALEVARRVNVPLAGVALPGHFVLMCESARGSEEGWLFDPFHGGRSLSLEDCRQMVEHAAGQSVERGEEYFRPATKLEILVRIARNLKAAHLRAGDLPRALAAVERIMILRPSDYGEIRERGLILAKLGLATKALVDLETYLRLDPDAVDSDEVWEQVRAIRGARSMLI